MPERRSIDNLEKMLANGKDGALLRFGLGSEYLKAGDAGMAAGHLQRALALDPDYSAAWKLLGQALTQLSRHSEALAAYRRGIEAAQRNGDLQAVKEMQVFARRIEKNQ
jgi:Tfp pilus assembly protein PilF